MKKFASFYRDRIFQRGETDIIVSANAYYDIAVWSFGVTIDFTSGFNLGIQVGPLNVYAAIEGCTHYEDISGELVAMLDSNGD